MGNAIGTSNCARRLVICLYTLRLALKVVIAASFRNIDSFPKCVVLSLTITEIMMIIVTIVHRASGILFVFCLLSWISNVSAISHPNSGILLAGTAFLPSLVFLAVLPRTVDRLSLSWVSFSHPSGVL